MVTKPAWFQKVLSESSNIDNGFSLIFKLMRGERIHISLKAGHYWPVSETPFDDGTTLNAGLVAL